MQKRSLVQDEMDIDCIHCVLEATNTKTPVHFAIELVETRMKPMSTSDIPKLVSIVAEFRSKK